MDISIIIVNYNSANYTVNVIDSIYKFTVGLSFEIIVVDNHSKSDDILFLENHLLKAKFKLIKSKIN